MRRAAAAATVAEALRLTAEENPDITAVRTHDDAISLTWSELRETVDAYAGGLYRMGVRRGDTVALMLSNRPEFQIADLAVMTLGATPFSIYLTSSAEQVAYLVRDAGARVAIVEPAFAPLFDVEQLIVVGEESWTSLPDPGFDAEPHWRAVTPDDIVTLIYTSGTTGPPKGVQLAHRNQMAAAGAVQERVQFGPGSRVISWLPAAHVAERTAHHYLPLTYGMTITTCPDPRQIGTFLPLVRPTWFFAVPRVFEKMRAAVEAQLPEQAVPLLRASEQRIDRGEPFEDHSLFAGLREKLGLDQCEVLNVGAAPIPREVLVFFHAIGLPLAEIWGMSETCGAGASNPPDAIKIGTVGKASPGAELKVAADGELLMRSKVVMVGYRNLPERTAEALDDEGWLHTGDVATIDDDGYVTIVDRKKELIISAGGKNMSPANIEAELKGASPLIGQACVIGDGRPYNTALIVLDPEYADGRDPAPLVQAAVEAANAKLSRPEQIKRFHIVDGDWLPGGDELTPTMKLKRRPIADKYAGEIEAMYGRTHENVMS
jgi:long-subunit acyl-CoA synthetase (AMP-forming)